MTPPEWWSHHSHIDCVPREDMPQIDEADLTALIEWMAWNKIEVDEITLDASQLHFHQRVDLSRVASMPPAVYEKPLLVSRDLFVLDGNHRAVAHKQRGEPASCLRLDADFGEAIELLFSFAGTYAYGDGEAHAAY